MTGQNTENVALIFFSGNFEDLNCVGFVQIECRILILGMLLSKDGS